MGLYINKGIALFLCVEILIYIVISNTRKTKRTQAWEYPMSVSVLSCCSFSATDSSCAGHKKPAGKKLFFSDSGAISRPDFFR
mgnify:CR=1 FL=1